METISSTLGTSESRKKITFWDINLYLSTNRSHIWYYEDKELLRKTVSNEAIMQALEKGLIEEREMRWKPGTDETIKNNACCFVVIRKNEFMELMAI